MFRRTRTAGKSSMGRVFCRSVRMAEFFQKFMTVCIMLWIQFKETSLLIYIIKKAFQIEISAFHGVPVNWRLPPIKGYTGTFHKTNLSIIRRA